MEKIVELEGKSLDQLVEKACQDLGCLPPDLEIEIKEFEPGGILGSGRKIKAVFKIKLEKLLSERANRALTFFKELCFYSDFNLETQTQILKDQREIVIILSGEDTKYLLQNGGEALSAIEFLVNKVVAKALGVGPKITLKIKGVDIERERKLARAVRKALELIRKDKKERAIKIGNKREERLVLNIIKKEEDFEAEVIEDQKGKRVILRVKNP